MSCAICRTRKERRYCPGVHGDICSLCCGNEREVTIDCPFDCPYLQEARKHEHTGVLTSESIPNQDIRVTEEFLEEHDDLLLATSKILMLAALETPGTVDRDVAEALEALIRTQRTLQSGVHYETHPDNAIANRIFIGAQAGLAEFRKKEKEASGMSQTRDADVLGVLVFLQRLELDRHNERPRGRAFLDSLRGLLSQADIAAIPASPASSLIVP